MRVLFVAHLLVPLALIIEMVNRWAFPDGPPGAPSLMGTVEYTVLAIALAWLLMGIAALQLTPQKFAKPLISIYTVYAVVALLLLWGSLPPGPSLWPPNRSVTLTPDPQYLPGLLDAAVFTTNDLGLRGPQWPANPDVYKIIAIGGSTTESLYLDDGETWPQLLMDRLPDTWVGNAGQSGRNTIDHLVLMESLPVVREADLLVFLIGVNDFQPAITFGGGTTEEILARNGEEFRQQLLNGGHKPGGSPQALRQLKLYQAFVHSGMARRFGVTPPSTEFQLGMGSGIWFEELRQRRRAAESLPMPDLTTGVVEYEQRVLRIAGRCENYGVRCVFLTQPSLWREDLPAAEERLLWLGWVAPLHQAKGYVTAADLSQGMALFNKALLDVCASHGLECYDLAAAVPNRADYFYDGVHLNEAGSVLVADHLADFLSD